MKNKLPLLLSLALLLTSTSISRAQTMTNGSFNLEGGNLNSFAGESTGSEYNINITSGETGSGIYDGDGYSVKAGFQYLQGKKGFSFTLSNSKIDFGTLSPTNPVTRTSILSISNNSASSYQVTVSENHQLQAAKTGAIIPDTTCDNGSCSESKSGAWSNTLTYGLGYRCDSESIATTGGRTCINGDSSFSNEDYFKQFADVSRSEKAQVVVSGLKGNNQKATVTYKVNIPSSQATGVYSNSITYIATPNY
jgi:hypothetical protein